MSPGDRESAPRLEGASRNIGTTTDSHHVSGPPRAPTQTDRVLAMLLEADEVCGSQMYAAFIPRFSVSIHKLRQAGYVIGKRPCDIHGHEGTGWLYELVALPHDPTEGV